MILFVMMRGLRRLLAEMMKNEWRGMNIEAEKVICLRCGKKKLGEFGFLWYVAGVF